MRHKLIIIMLLICGVCQAKTKLPEWMNEANREKLFPQSSYYTGYAVAQIGKNDSVESTLKRLTQSAYGNLLSKISVTIQHNASDSKREFVGTSDAYSENIYSSTTQLSTRMTEIPGVEVKSFVDSETRMAAVLAYVQKAGLATKLQRQLITLMTRVEVKLEDAEGFMQEGIKTKVRETLADARELLLKAEDTRNTMLAIDASLTSEDLMDAEWREAEKRIIDIETEQNRTVKIFMTCKLGETTENSLCRTVCGELYRNGCEVVDSLSQAEWTVEITAKTEREYNQVKAGDYIFYYSYATAVLIIYDKEGRTVYKDELRSKGSHTKSFDYSSADAIKKLSITISDIIKSTIQK